MTIRKAQINIRVTDELKEKLHSSAKSKGQSVNSEIVRRLWESFDGEKTVHEKLMETLVDVPDDRLKAMAAFIESLEKTDILKESKNHKQ